MALINPNTGEYLKIYDIHIELKNNSHNFWYNIFLNEDQRLRYDTNLSEYETFKKCFYNSSSKIDTKINESLENDSIKNALLTFCYEFLKSEETFKDWIDG
jgi:hypothetical protein